MNRPIALRLGLAIGVVVAAAVAFGAYLYVQKQHELERMQAGLRASEQRAQEEQQRLRTALAEQRQQVEELQRQAAIEKLKLQAAEDERQRLLEQELNKIEAEKRTKEQISKRRQEKARAPVNRKSQDGSAAMTAKVSIAIRSTTCVEVEAGKYLIDMSGDINGPAGTYFFYAASNPNSGIASMRTSCDSWSRTGAEDGPRKQNMCKHQSREATQTRWSSHNIFNSQQPPKGAIALLFEDNPDGTAFKRLEEQRAALACQR